MENWKKIIGFEAYEVSNLGRVRSIDRLVNHPSGGYAKRPSIILKGIPDKDGYLRVNLKVHQKTNTRNIHRLVAEAFIPNPDNKPQVNHKDGIKYHNYEDNLEWNTLSENRVHAYENGLQNGKSREGIKNNFHKLKEEDVLFIKNNKLTQWQFAMIFNVTQSCISAIKRNKAWKHL